MERIRVLQFIPNLGVGGAERMMLSLATGLDRKRYNVTVLSFFDGAGSPMQRELAASGIASVSLGKHMGFDTWMFPRVQDMLRRHDTDLIHSHRAVFPYALPAVVGRRRPRFVHTVHNVAGKEVADRLRRSAHWLAFRAGVSPVAICDFVARSIVRVHGVEPCATIPNGIPVAQFARTPAEGRAWRAANGVPDRAVVF